ncbi:MAG: carboxypeptidase regulatory-like domain-containing protein [Candidatus Acidiferrales bacterium]
MRTLKVWTWALVLAMFVPSAVGAPPNSPSPQAVQSSKAAAPAGQEEASAARLPVRRVILYKSGVGYFEHLGQVQGNEEVRIDFTNSQLNDVLQSLTVLDLGGGRIAGVTYNSEAPFSQQLGTLRLPIAEKTNLSEFYGALRGARLEIHSGTSVITGRLLSVERKTRVSGGTTLEVDLATVVSDSGEARSVEITPAVTVRLADRDVTEEVSRYLSLLASERQADLRRMTIATAGSGARQLYVSYISEVPIWKTTYRIVLSSKPDSQPLLQGWAIVDNTVGEDWNDVDLSLVAGAPQSFIQQLSQPYYARRPVVPLPQNVQLSPQTHESAMLGGLAGLSGTVTDTTGAVIPNAQVRLLTDSGAVAASTTADSNGFYKFGDLPAGNYSLEFESRGFKKVVIQGLSLGGGRTQVEDAQLEIGSVTETVTVTAAQERANTTSGELSTTTEGESGNNVGSGGELGSANGGGARLGRGVAGGVMGGIAASPSPMAEPEAIAEARRQTEAAAQGSQLGDLFEYKLKGRVTIHKNESALVPIVQTHVDAEKVSLWNTSLNSPRPLRALWLTNSSPLTLDGGSFSVLEDEAFAGEGLTDPIKPGEKRLLSYAADLGVRVNATTESDPQRVTHVHIDHGVMKQTSELRQKTTYTVRNDDTVPRMLLIERPLRVGWTLAQDDPAPAETTSDVYRFRLSLDPQASTSLEIKESTPVNTAYQLTNLTSDQVTFFVDQKEINPEVEAALRKIVDQENAVAALNQQISDRDDERQKIYDDQQRLRENMKALKGTPEERALTQRYTQQLNDQENRLDTLQRESTDLQAKLDQAQTDLNNMIENLNLDTDI